MAKTAAWCAVCQKTSEETRFGGGRSGVCNYCSKKGWNERNPLKVRSQRLYGNAQKRAREMGWPSPDFSSTYIEQKILNGFCEVTGIPFDLTSSFSDTVHAKNPWVPSIDRIDSSLPYSKDNIQIVVFMYNVCKSEFSHHDVMTFVNALYKKEKEIGL